MSTKCRNILMSYLPRKISRNIYEKHNFSLLNGTNWYCNYKGELLHPKWIKAPNISQRAEFLSFGQRILLDEFCSFQKFNGPNQKENFSRYQIVEICSFADCSLTWTIIFLFIVQIVCSFLVRDMGIDWRMGAEWFETCLLDYDPCSNYGNWTYGAGYSFILNLYHISIILYWYNPSTPIQIQHIWTHCHFFCYCESCLWDIQSLC